MNTPEEITKLAWQRLQEAQVLYGAKMYDGAFYLAGYSVELMFKANVCKKLSIPNLFDENDRDVNAIKGISELRKLLKTHNLFLLLIVSGLKYKFDTDKASNKELAKANSLLFSCWDENARYKPCGHVKNQDIDKLLKLLSDPQNGLLSWIEKN